MLHSTVFNTAQVCHQLGVEHAVMSPGSRNAPLTISFARHSEIKKWIIPDERAAAFIALGIAQEVKSPVVLCCTSGTALLNYSPAIAEAYYREIPLIVLSADRPPELIDQRDGQTIRQFEALKNHVKSSVQFPLIRIEADANDYENKLIEIVNQSMTGPHGPVHANIPFEEPFYPSLEDNLSYSKIEINAINHLEKRPPVLDCAAYSKVLVLIGQNDFDTELDDAIDAISEKLPVLKFPLNNLTNGIESTDLFIDDQNGLSPDLLITSGLSVLSKKMKNFLRSNKPRRHLHFDINGVKVDTFQTDPEIVECKLSDFLTQQIFEELDPNYLQLWTSRSKKAGLLEEEYMSKATFSETLAAKQILVSVPKGSNLHLSNSMPVRYADFFKVPNEVACFSNRGTSGIDGCTSTALGSALVSDKLNVLITGDLAFFYDRNAFFHNHRSSNLRIIVLNNKGGGIFRLIDGPSELPELEDYFETRHNRTAEYICAENDLEYIKSNDFDSLKTSLENFYIPSSKTKVLEVFTDPKTNQKVYRELKKYINERIKN